MNNVKEIERFLDMRWLQGKDVSEHELLYKIDADENENRRAILIEMMKRDVDFAQSFLKMFPSYFSFIKEHVIEKTQDNMYKLVEIDCRNDTTVDDYIDYVETSGGALFLAQIMDNPDLRLRRMIDGFQDAISWVETFQQDIRHMRGIVKHNDDDFWVDRWNTLMNKLNESELKIY